MQLLRDYLSVSNMNKTLELNEYNRKHLFGYLSITICYGGEMGFRNTSLTCILAISDLTHFIDSVGRNSYGDPLNLSLYLLQFLKTFLSPSSHVVNKVSRQTNHKQRIIVSPVSKSLPRQYGRRGRKRKTWIDSWKIFVI